MPGGQLDLGVRIGEHFRQLGHDGGQGCAELPGRAVSHGAQHLHAALLASPGSAVHTLQQAGQHQLHACSCIPQ